MWRVLVCLLIVAASVDAAVLQGAVYTFDLSVANDSIVEINTTPNQLLVAKNGSYRFSVPAGRFMVTAIKDELFVEEAIAVQDDGEYVLDLILLPELSVEESLMDSDEELVLPYVPDQTFSNSWVVASIVLAVVLCVGWLFSRKKEKLPTDLGRILQIIDKAGGRIAQKDVYRSVEWSESKVSLMLDDLEARGIVYRVKKGRAKVVFRK